MNAAAIAAALGGHRSGSWHRARCPSHGSTSSTLALRDGAHGLILYCHAGCSRADVLDALVRRGLDPDAAAPDPAALQRQRAQEERGRQKRSAEALDFWQNETADPHDTVVERYWRWRGLSLPLPMTIRASRGWIRHPDGGDRPAMVAMVEHVDHGSVGIHRTFLAVDGSGKASFRSPRLSLGPVGGAAIRLADASEHKPLIIGEGIETVASVMVATGLPGWAALSAGGIERLVLPHLPLAATVIIAADHDLNGVGERAARTAADRWVREGRRVNIAIPPTPGTDWNDVLLNKDIKGIRDAA